jgi:serine/threonine protein kinase
MHPVQLDESRLFAGRYRVVRCIAAGGMGAVYEVLHVETERRRALKVILPMLVASADLRERFQREARVTAKVNSEFIVDVFDAGVDQETAMPFLVMELLQGEELGERVKRLGSLPSAEVLTFLRQVTTALDKTHAAGIVHRDLKPENLYLTTRDDGSPRIKILDFGISKVLTDNATGAKATQSLGTPLYMAPEQVMGEPVSAATDLYALGFIAYTLLVGVSYWQEETDRFETAIAFALHTCRGAHESPTARAARVGKTLPAGFDEWFFKATHTSPAQRFARASELYAALAGVLGDGVQLPSAPPLAPPSPSITPAARAITGASVTAPSPAHTGSAPAFSATRPPLPARKSHWLLAAGAVFVLAAAASATALLVQRSSSAAAIASTSAARDSTPIAASVVTEAPASAPAPAASLAAPPANIAVTPVAAASASASVARPATPLAPATPPAPARRPAASPPRASAAAPTPPAAPIPKYTRD